MEDTIMKIKVSCTFSNNCAIAFYVTDGSPPTSCLRIIPVDVQYPREFRVQSAYLQKKMN